MDLGNIVTKILSSVLSSSESTYSNMSRNRNLSDEQREELRDRARESRERRNTLRESGLKGFMETYRSDDDDYWKIILKRITQVTKKFGFLG